MRNNDEFGTHKGTKSWLLAASALAVLTAGVSIRTNANADTIGESATVLVPIAPIILPIVGSTNGAAATSTVTVGTAATPVATPTDTIATAQAAVTTASNAVAAAQTVVNSTQKSLDSLTVAQTSAQQASSDASTALSKASDNASQASTAVSSAASALEAALSNNPAVSSASTALSEATNTMSLASTAVSAAQDNAAAAGNALTIANTNAISTALDYTTAITAVNNFVNSYSNDGTFDPESLHGNLKSDYKTLVKVATSASDSANLAMASLNTANDNNTSTLNALDTAQSNYSTASKAVSAGTTNLASAVSAAAVNLPEAKAYQDAKANLANALTEVASATDVSTKASSILSDINAQIAAIQSALNTANANLAMAQSDLTVAESTLVAVQAGQTSTQVTTSLLQAKVTAPPVTSTIDTVDKVPITVTFVNGDNPTDYLSPTADWLTSNNIQYNGNGTYTYYATLTGTGETFSIPAFPTDVSGFQTDNGAYTIDTITYDSLIVNSGPHTFSSTGELVYTYEDVPKNNVDYIPGSYTNSIDPTKGLPITGDGRFPALNGGDFNIYITLEDPNGNMIGSMPGYTVVNGNVTINWSFPSDSLKDGTYTVEIDVYDITGGNPGHPNTEDHLLRFEQELFVIVKTPAPIDSTNPTVPPSPDTPPITPIVPPDTQPITVTTPPSTGPITVTPPISLPDSTNPSVTLPPDGSDPTVTLPPQQTTPNPGPNQNQNPNKPWVTLPLDFPPKGQSDGDGQGQSQLPKTGEASDHSVMIGAALVMMGAASALVAYGGNSEKRRKMLLDLAADDQDLIE